MRLLQHVLNAIVGVWELLRIAIKSRLGGGRAYWQWRRETAFGKHAGSLTKRDQRHAMLRFGMWLSRMKRFR